MANPEWYSGSDSSGRVAAAIEEIIARMDAQTAGVEDVERLHELTSVEHEANWRSFLLGLAGTIHYDLDDVETAREILERSIAGAKPYLESFDGVLSVYCQSCYTLGVIHHDAARFVEAVPFFLRCLPYMHEVYDDVYVGNIHSFLATCMAWARQPDWSSVFAEAAAYARRWDCESLEQLMVSYGARGDLDRATEVFHMMQADCRGYEHFDRVLEYARRNLGESGTVN